MAEVDGVAALLKITDSPVLSQFLHDCVDDLVKIRSANFDNYNNDIEWTIDDFNKAKTSVQNFYRKCIENRTIDYKIDNLSENIQNELENCYEIRKNDIYEQIIKENLIENGHNLVETFDWRLKWILGNSKLASIREAILQMDLYCLKKSENSESNGIDKNLVNVEMHLETVADLIQQLEKVKKQIDKSNKD